jgi:hypothetical protein
MCHGRGRAVTAAARPYRDVAEASKPFESRWTLRALAVADKELYHRFLDQQSLWHAALMSGDEDDVRTETAAMCRGWEAITRRMEELKEPDCAYLIGVDPNTGTRVAIMDQVAARERVRVVEGEEVICITPHEVATMLASAQVLASMKGFFPGAELIDLYPTEPRAA